MEFEDDENSGEFLDISENHPITHGLVWYSEKINTFEAEEPQDKRTKEYKEWKTELSKMYKTYNEAAGFEAYNEIF